MRPGSAHSALITLKVWMLSYGIGDLQYLYELPVWGEWLKLSWEVEVRRGRRVWEQEREAQEGKLGYWGWPCGAKGL